MCIKYYVCIVICQLFLFIGFSNDVFASDTNSVIEVNGKIGAIRGNDSSTESENSDHTPKREIQIELSAQDRQLRLPQTGNLSENWTIIFGMSLLLVYSLLKVKNKQNPKFN